MYFKLASAQYFSKENNGRVISDGATTPKPHRPATFKFASFIFRDVTTASVFISAPTLISTQSI
jgi:hypothetical protein